MPAPGLSPRQVTSPMVRQRSGNSGLVASLAHPGG
jgi:hypothetical protein